MKSEDAQGKRDRKMAQVLVCGSCGGPLPRPTPGDPNVTCQFCGATTDLDSGERRQGSADIVAAINRIPKARDAFEKELNERIARHEPIVPAFRAAAESTLSAICDPDAITNVVFGIATDFDRANGTDVTQDPNVLPRLGLAYIQSVQTLATEPEYEINLPFLTATSKGPLHFRQSVTIARLKELAAIPPTQRAAKKDPPPPAPPVAAPPVVQPANQPWWKKLLG